MQVFSSRHQAHIFAHWHSVWVSQGRTNQHSCPCRVASNTWLQGAIWIHMGQKLPKKAECWCRISNTSPVMSGYKFAGCATPSSTGLAPWTWPSSRSVIVGWAIDVQLAENHMQHLGLVKHIILLYIYHTWCRFMMIYLARKQMQNVSCWRLHIVPVSWKWRHVGARRQWRKSIQTKDIQKLFLFWYPHSKHL